MNKNAAAEKISTEPQLAATDADATVATHGYFKGSPFVFPKEDLTRLSQISAFKWIAATAASWGLIIFSVWLCETHWHIAYYIGALIIIGACQNGFLILDHDATHYRLLKNKKINDWIADTFMALPMFITTSEYRFLLHAEHHRFVSTSKDPERKAFKTHNASGLLNEKWKFPKPMYKLFASMLSEIYLRLYDVLAFRVRSLFLELRSMQITKQTGGVLAFYVVVAAAFTFFGEWKIFLLYWIAPYCLVYSQIFSLRVRFEHHGTAGPYATRTIIPQTFFDNLVVPWNTGYHIEHHYYPSIPFYNLPEAHRILMQDPNFKKSAHICHGVWAALRELTRGHTE